MLATSPTPRDDPPGPAASDHDGTLAGSRGSGASKQLGAAIRLLRRRAGLSQAAVAAQFGLTYQQWQKYETGQNRISAVSLQALARLLGIDIRRFFLGFDGYALVHPLELQSTLKARQGAQMMATLPAADQDAVVALAAHLARRHDGPVPAAPHGGAAAQPVVAVRVLLVDDDEDALNMTAMMLRAAGFAVSLASGGDQAFAALARQSFDAIVSDYAMPGMNGAALLELALERQPDLAAVMITGYATDSGLYNLPDTVCILAKPFTRRDIVACLQAALQKRPAGGRSLAAAP